MPHSPSDETSAAWPKPVGYTPQDHDLMVTLWDYARTARLSELYYGESGAGWSAGLTALLAIAKPLLALDRKLRHASQQQQTYRRLLGTFENLAFDIQQAGTLTAEHRQRFQRAREILRQAEELDDGAIARSKLSPLEARVKQEMPADRLWVPEVQAGAALA